MRILNYRYFASCMKQSGIASASQTPRKSRVIEINLEDYAIVTNNSRDKHRSSSSKKRHEFASTLYLPKEFIHANREEDHLTKSKLFVYPRPNNALKAVAQS